MNQDAQHGRAMRSLIQLCTEGLDADALRAEVLRRLPSLIPTDAAWFATTDPATLLYTSAVVDSVLRPAARQFVANEFLEDDVNRFARLATSERRVGGLVQASRTATQPSRRARDILAPLHLGDELRAALTVGGACWGYLCLHREQGSPDFTAAEMAALTALAPHLAAGLRHALLVPRLFPPSAAAGPGVVVLDANLALVACTPAAEQWLDEVDAIDWPSTGELPVVIGAVAARLQALDRGNAWLPAQMPRARLRTRAGRWVVVHAAHLHGPHTGGQIAIVLEEARAPEVVPLVGRAYGLSTREWEVTQLVLRGQSTGAIVTALSIASTTVQDHLKAIFEKVGVHSRRELVAQFFAEQYLPRIMAGHQPGFDGAFSV